MLFRDDCNIRMHIPALPFSRYEKTMQKPHPQGYPVEPKTIGEHLRKRRMDLGLYQAEVARRFNVSEDCITYWENGRSVPQVRYYPQVIAFLGYYPFNHETDTFGGKITRYKNEHGLSYRKLAKLFDADPATVAEWERNSRVPLKRSMDIVLSVITKNAAH